MVVPVRTWDFIGSFRNFRSSAGRRISAEMRDGVIVSKGGD